MSVLPSPTSRSFLLRESASAIPLGLAAIVPSGILVAKTWGDPASPPWQQWGAVALCAIAVGGNALKAYQVIWKDRKEASKQSPLGLQGALYALHGSILGMKDIPYHVAHERPCPLRITIHRVSEDGHTVEQIVPYVGDDSGGAGRKFSSRSGVVGRAITTKGPALLVRSQADFGAYAETLKREWAMPEDEAYQLSKDRFSFLAVPFTGKDKKVVGVLFLDSREPDFFDSADLVARITVACAGVAQYCKMRYGE